jgi:uncharacterized membrane protein
MNGKINYMSDSNQQPKLIDERLFKRNSFWFILFVLFSPFLIYVSWPIRNIVLVCWFYGIHGYFKDGIRVSPDKPFKFSTGAEVAGLPDFVTGLGAFLFTVIGLSLMLTFAFRFYERYFGRRGDTQ